MFVCALSGAAAHRFYIHLKSRITGKGVLQFQKDKCICACVFRVLHLLHFNTIKQDVYLLYSNTIRQDIWSLLHGVHEEHRPPLCRYCNVLQQNQDSLLFRGIIKIIMKRKRGNC
ncbi:uncharacterized protein LOC109610632 isoform X3 [Ooceraea biroi]|uniref:uncharacterized protein LOC109610632 isoform X3 n=1 Tax=Ooceraea biroi TaxID=2015173 RepID=UPI00097162F3|nr:uncharacterized protein LOC109610632 isoform X3 [Ooceraea biroi]